MGDGSYVSYASYAEAGGLKRTNGCLPAGAGALDEHFHLLQPLVHCLSGGLLRGPLSRKGGAFTRPLKATGTRTGPTDGIALGIREGYLRIVKGGANIGSPIGGYPSFSPSAPLSCHEI